MKCSTVNKLCAFQLFSPHIFRHPSKSIQSNSTGIVGRKRHPISKGGRIAKTFTSEKELRDAISTCCKSKAAKKGEVKKARPPKKSSKTAQKGVQFSPASEHESEDESSGNESDDEEVNVEDEIKTESKKQGNASNTKVKVVTVKSIKGSQDMQKITVPKKTEPPAKVTPKTVEKEKQPMVITQRKKIESYLQTPKASSSSSDDDSQSKKNSFQSVFEEQVAKLNGSKEKQTVKKRPVSVTNVNKTSSSNSDKGDTEPDIKKRKMVEIPTVSFQDQVIKNAELLENANSNIIVMKQENLKKTSVNYLGTNISPSQSISSIQKSGKDLKDDSTSKAVKSERSLPVKVEAHKDIEQELMQLTQDIISQQSGMSQWLVDNQNNVTKGKSTSLSQQNQLQSQFEFGKNAPNLTFSKLAHQASSSKYKPNLCQGSDMNLQSTINRLSTSLHTKPPIQKQSESNVLLTAQPEAVPVRENLSVDVASNNMEISQTGLSSPVRIIKQGLKSPTLVSKNIVVSPKQARADIKSPQMNMQQHNPNVDVVKIQSPKGTQNIVHVQSALSPMGLNKQTLLVGSNKSPGNTRVSAHASPPSVLNISPGNISQNASSPLLSPPNIVQNTLPSPSLSNVSRSPPMLSPVVPRTNEPVPVNSRPTSTNVGVIQVNPSFSTVNNGTVNSGISLANSLNQANQSFSPISSTSLTSGFRPTVSNMVNNDRSLPVGSANTFITRNSVVNNSNQVINNPLMNINQIATTPMNNFNSSNLGNAAINVMNSSNLGNSTMNMNNVNNHGSVIQTTPVYSTGQMASSQNFQMISNQGMNQTVNSGMLLQQQQPLHAQAAGLALQSNSAINMNRMSSPQIATVANQNFLGQVPLAVTIQGNNTPQVIPQNFVSGNQITTHNGQHMQQGIISHGNQTFLVNIPVVGTHITTTMSTGNVVMPTGTNVTTSLSQGKTQTVGQVLIHDPKTKALRIIPSVLNPNVLRARAVNPGTKQVRFVAVKGPIATQKVSNSTLPLQQSQLLIPAPSVNTTVKSSTSTGVVSVTGSARQPTVSELLKASANQTVASTALSTASIQGEKGKIKPETKVVKPILLPVTPQSNTGIMNTSSLLGGLSSQTVQQSILSTSVMNPGNSEKKSCVLVNPNDLQTLSVNKENVSTDKGALTVKVSTSSSESLTSPKLLSPNKTVQLIPQPIVPISQAFTTSYTSTLPTSDDQPIHNYAMPAQLFEEDSNDAKPPSLEMEAPVLEMEPSLLKLENALSSGVVKNEPEALTKYNEPMGSNVSGQLNVIKTEMDSLPKYPVTTISESSQTFVQTTSYSSFVGTGESKPKRKRQKSGTRETAHKDSADQIHKPKVIKVNF